MKGRYPTILLTLLVLASCSQPVPIDRPNEALLDKKWVLLQLGDDTPSPGDVWEYDGFRNLSLTFTDGEITGYDGCNAFGGDYTATSTNLDITVGESTLIGCETPILEQGAAFTAALSDTAFYEIKGDALELQNSAGETILWFTYADAEYKLTLDLKSEVPVALDERSMIKITVFGDDQNIVDEIATTLADEVTALPSLDTKPSVGFSEEDLLALDYSSGPNALLSYFMAFDIDADGDGRMCLGDYRQDFDRTETRFYEQGDTGEQVQEIYITEITDPYACYAF